MDKDFFKQVRILDGGMGQELLARGLNSQGTLWSAKALLDEKNHSLVESVHEDFVKAGAEVIVTNTFATRKIRLKQNNLEDKFEILNKYAGKIAKKVKDKYPLILIAGGLPPQNKTYSSDMRDETEIFNNFKDQAKILNPYVDFFYLLGGPRGSQEACGGSGRVGPGLPFPHRRPWSKMGPIPFTPPFAPLSSPQLHST